MKQWPVYVLLIFTLASCSSFSRVKYGHVRKVPAQQAEAVTKEKGTVAAQASVVQSPVVQSPVEQPAVEQSAVEQSAVGAPVSVDTILPDGTVDRADPSEALAEENADADSVKILSRAQPTELPLPLPTARASRNLPANFQLFFGVLFLLSGIALLFVSVFFMPYLPWPWLLILFAEIAALFTSWRMIRRGIAFLQARFGSRKSYQEN